MRGHESFVFMFVLATNSLLQIVFCEHSSPNSEEPREASSYAESMAHVEIKTRSYVKRSDNVTVHGKMGFERGSIISSKPSPPHETYSSGEEWPDDTPPEILAECTNHGFLLLPSGTYVALARPVWLIINPQSKPRTRKCICDWSHAFVSALNLLKINKDDFATEYEKSPWYAKYLLNNMNCDLVRNTWPPQPPPSQPRTPKKQAEDKRKLSRRHSDVSSKGSSASRSSKHGSFKIGLPKVAFMRTKSAAVIIKPLKSMLRRKSAADLFGLKRSKSKP